MTDDGMRRGAALMASGTAVSRVLGLLRGMVMVSAIGATGQAADAFAVANNLPNILYMLLAGGVLNAILVPQVVRAYKRKAGQEYVDRLLTFGFVGAGRARPWSSRSLAPLLVDLYSNFGNPTQDALATTFAYWCIPQLFFYGAYALLGPGPQRTRLVRAVHVGARRQQRRRDRRVRRLHRRVRASGTPRASPTPSTWTSGQIALLAGSATLGVVAQAVVLVPALRRAGVHYRPRWGLRGSGLGTAGRRRDVDARWASTVGPARVPRRAPGCRRPRRPRPSATGYAASAVAGPGAYDVAFLIFMLPHSLVTVSLATALFTRLSGQAHDDDVAGVRATLSSGLRVVGVFTVFATAAIAVLALPLTRVVLATATAGRPTRSPPSCSR